MRKLLTPFLEQEPLPDPTSQELQREAQEEAKIFAAQGESARCTDLAIVGADSRFPFSCQRDDR